VRCNVFPSLEPAFGWALLRALGFEASPFLGCFLLLPSTHTDSFSSTVSILFFMVRFHANRPVPFNDFAGISLGSFQVISTSAARVDFFRGFRGLGHRFPCFPPFETVGFYFSPLPQKSPVGPALVRTPFPTVGCLSHSLFSPAARSNGSGTRPLFLLSIPPWLAQKKGPCLPFRFFRPFLSPLFTK